MNRIIRIGLLIFAFISIASAYYIYKTYIGGANVPKDLEEEFLYIPTGSSFEEVVDLLKSNNFIEDERSFRWFADYMKYTKPTMRSGRFKITPGWSNIQLIRQLRNGKQAPVNVVLHNERLLEEVAGKVANALEADSMAFLNAFTSEAKLLELGYTQEELMSLFIPNTYEFFWNTPPEAFIDRMKKEHDRFWDKDKRRSKADALKLDEKEVYTLASIIEKETLDGSEKPKMAGVYLNRLKKGILLQADPTSVFARRDFTARRVTDYHTQYDSPYNTYKYRGLPPGPISLTSISSIDAVLNAENHDYIYFCAKGDGSGLHNFAKTLAAHNQNAQIYKRNLRKRGLR